MLQTLLALFFAAATCAQAVTPNEPAPPIALHNSQHQLRELSRYKGKVVLVNFWASWCGPCQEELPELNRLAADYNDASVKVLAINVDSERSAAVHLLAKLGLQHPTLEILWDAKSKVVSTYNIETMPSSYIIDRKGTVRFLHTGFRRQDPAIWRREIKSLR